VNLSRGVIWTSGFRAVRARRDPSAPLQQLQLYLSRKGAIAAAALLGLSMLMPAPAQARHHCGRGHIYRISLGVCGERMGRRETPAAPKADRIAAKIPARLPAAMPGPAPITAAPARGCKAAAEPTFGAQPFRSILLARRPASLFDYLKVDAP
jgi:hypothetical protein